MAYLVERITPPGIRVNITFGLGNASGSDSSGIIQLFSSDIRGVPTALPKSIDFTASIFKCNSWSLSSNFFKCKESCAVHTCEYANTAVRHSAIVVITRFNPSILFTLSLPIFRSTSYTFVRIRGYLLSVIIPLSAAKDY